MKLDNEFTVGVPIEQAWAVLTDLELIAPCMPGAQLTGVTGDVYSGKVKIKVGPVTAEYAGTAQFSVKDETAYRAVIDARGRDSRGNGHATALISAQLQPAGGSTKVSVSTDLTIAGRIAQFGSGMIKEVSAKLLGQFVTCLEGKLGSGAVTQVAAIGAEGSGAAGSAATTSARAGIAGSASAAGMAGSASAAGIAGSASAAGIAGAASAAGIVSAAGMAAAPGIASDSGQPTGSSAPASTGATSAAGDGDQRSGQAAGAAPVSAETPLGSPGPGPAALNLMSVAGRAIFKRLAPLVAGLIVLAVVIYLIVR